MQIAVEWFGKKKVCGFFKNQLRSTHSPKNVCWGLFLSYPDRVTNDTKSLCRSHVMNLQTFGEAESLK